MKENELIEGLKKRDNKASRYFFAQVEPIVYNFCFHEVSKCSDAQDLVQETFFRFLLTLDGFRGECSLQTRIIGIAISVCKNYNSLKK